MSLAWWCLVSGYVVSILALISLMADWFVSILDGNQYQRSRLLLHLFVILLAWMVVPFLSFAVCKVVSKISNSIVYQIDSIDRS